MTAKRPAAGVSHQVTRVRRGLRRRRLGWTRRARELTPRQFGVDFDIALRMLERAAIREIATFERRERTMRGIRRVVRFSLLDIIPTSQ